MVGSVTSNNIGRTSKHVVAVLHATSRIIETISVSVKTPLYPHNIAIWMNKLSYRQRRRDNMRGWNVILLTATDIKKQQRLKARDSNPL